MSHLGKRIKLDQGLTVNIPNSLILHKSTINEFSPQEYKEFQNQGGIMLPIKFYDIFEQKGIMQDGVIFRIHCAKNMILCLCGLYTFHSYDQDAVFIPNWMQEYMGIKPGDSIFMDTYKPRKCTSIKIKPENCKFYELQDAATALTESLPKYKAVVKGQWLCMNYQNQDFWLKIVDCTPTIASLINTDVKCEFEAADGLEQYEKEKTVKNILDILDKDEEQQPKEQIIPITKLNIQQQPTNQQPIQQTQNKYAFGNSKGHTL